MWSLSVDTLSLLVIWAASFHFCGPSTMRLVLTSSQAMVENLAKGNTINRGKLLFEILVCTVQFQSRSFDACHMLPFLAKPTLQVWVSCEFEAIDPYPYPPYPYTLTRWVLCTHVKHYCWAWYEFIWDSEVTLWLPSSELLLSAIH